MNSSTFFVFVFLKGYSRKTRNDEKCNGNNTLMSFTNGGKLPYGVECERGRVHVFLQVAENVRQTVNHILGIDTTRKVVKN